MEQEDSSDVVLRIQSSLQKFIDTVDELENEDDPSGDGFTREFRVLRELGLKMREENTHPAEEGRKPYNIKKNRYKDILPFDETRVVLKTIDGEEGSDYINANYITDHKGVQSYIASQGPVPSTVNDFWRMIWQQNVKVMAMACRLVEMGKKKCEQYWPSDVEETQDFGSITVTLLSEEDFAEHCTKRVLKVQKGKKNRTVTQFHYTGWPDHDIPNDIDDILEMMAMMRQIRMQDTCSPMVVHCSAGCGRTGTICAIDYAWSELKSGTLTEDFNLYEIIKQMREQRQSMIQAPEQYKCAHIAIKILFEKHLQLMEDHTYGNVNFGEDDDESGYATPQSLKDAKPTRKVSAMVDIIENTINDLTSPWDGTKNDPTPVIVPQHVAPPPPSQAVKSIETRQGSVKATENDKVTENKAPKANKPAPFTAPDISRKPSVEIHSPMDKPPSPSVKNMVFNVEKIENIPHSAGNPTQTDAEKRTPSIKSSTITGQANGSAHMNSQAVKPDKPLLHRIESHQEDNKFRTVISVGAGGSTGKTPINKTVSDPGKGNLSRSHHGSQKSKTMPLKAMPGVYEAPQSSVPPSTPTQPSNSVYSFASDPDSHSYSILSPLSNGTQLSPVVHTGQPMNYDGSGEAGNQALAGGADVYAAVNKPARVPEIPNQAENVYEAVSMGQSKVHAPPPIPDRKYIEEEKMPAHEKPVSHGSSDQMNTLGKKKTFDHLKQMFTLRGGGHSENVTTSTIPGFKKRLDQQPAGPKKTPAMWTNNTKL